VQRFRYLVSVGWFYAGELAAIATGAGILVLLASVAVFFLAAGAVVVTVGYIREEAAYLASRVRGTDVRP